MSRLCRRQTNTVSDILGLSTSFCLFLKVASFVGLLPVLAACQISFLIYLCNCTIGKWSGWLIDCPRVADHDVLATLLQYGECTHNVDCGVIQADSIIARSDESSHPHY